MSTVFGDFPLGCALAGSGSGEDRTTQDWLLCDRGLLMTLSLGFLTCEIGGTVPGPIRL